MEDWYEAQKRQAAERRAKAEREELEYQADRERESAERAQREARDQKRRADSLRDEMDNERAEYEDALSDLRDRYSALNAVLVNTAVLSVPILTAFLLIPAEWITTPKGIAAEELKSAAEKLLSHLAPLNEAERKRMERKIARANSTDESED